MCHQKDDNLRGLQKLFIKWETSYRSQLMFRSSLHKIQTLEVNKVSLSKDDDKRIKIDGIRSLARGHFQLNL